MTERDNLRAAVEALADEVQAAFFAFRIDDPLHLRLRDLLAEHPTAEPQSEITPEQRQDAGLAGILAVHGVAVSKIVAGDRVVWQQPEPPRPMPDISEDHARRILARDHSPVTLPEPPSEHECETCPDCLHDGNRCCGCYDGACCKAEPPSVDAETLAEVDVNELADALMGVTFSPSRIETEDRIAEAILARFHVTPRAEGEQA
jgi:hypothetical protein